MKKDRAFFLMVWEIIIQGLRLLEILKGEQIMLGKFLNFGLAKAFSSMTTKMSVIILGDDERFWVVNLAKMEKLLRAGYELAK
jgi:hypothetical protein